MSILIMTRDCRKSVITELPTNQEVWALRCSDSPWLDRVFKDEQELHQQDKLGKPTACPSSFARISKELFSRGPTTPDICHFFTWAKFLDNNRKTPLFCVKSVENANFLR